MKSTSDTEAMRVHRPELKLRSLLKIPFVCNGGSMAKRAVGEGEEEQLPQAKRACEETTAEHLLKHMRLKRIVKENHGSEIRAVRGVLHYGRSNGAGCL